MLVRCAKAYVSVQELFKFVPRGVRNCSTAFLPFTKDGIWLIQKLSSSHYDLHSYFLCLIFYQTKTHFVFLGFSSFFFPLLTMEAEDGDRKQNFLRWRKRWAIVWIISSPDRVNALSAKASYWTEVWIHIETQTMFEKRDRVICFLRWDCFPTAQIPYNQFSLNHIWSNILKCNFSLKNHLIRWGQQSLQFSAEISVPKPLQRDVIKSIGFTSYHFG